MSITSAPSSSAIGQAAAGTGGGGSATPTVVVQVLGAYGGESVRNGLVETLQSTAGSGNILTGTVSEVRPDGSFSLQTKAGPELSLQQPPSLPLSVGSTVTLRILSVSPTPQVAILTVDGKLVTGPTANSALTSSVVAPPPIAAPPPAPAGLVPTALPGAALAPATLAATLFAAISLEDEIAIEAAVSDNGATVAGPGDVTLPEIAADAQSLIATLLRAAPARPGTTPIPAGTRYLATVTIGTAESAAPAAPVRLPTAALTITQAPDEEAAPPPAPADAVAPSAPISSAPAGPAVRPLDLTGFTSLVTVLAGRVSATSADGTQSLVETAIGTLAVPPPAAPLPVGTAIQLKVFAVAPPESTPAPTIAKPAVEAGSPPPTVLADSVSTLTVATPALAPQIERLLSLPPTDQLAALILSFLGALKPGAKPSLARWPDPPMRSALIAAGREDLAARLDADAGRIGDTRPTPAGDWSITMLPYLGLATREPMRLYRRNPEKADPQQNKGERFVIELRLVRLGALQLDGLVRERRFDLVLRSETALDHGLRQIIDRSFRDALLISGWSGELSYARTSAVPLFALPSDAAGIGLSA